MFVPRWWEISELEAIDIWRAAAQMVKLYGEGASFTAATRADALLDQGDTEGCHVWQRIVAAIGELGRHEPRDGEGVN